MSVPVVQTRVSLPDLRVRAVTRGISPAWAALLIALVLYGSFIPFRFTASEFVWLGLRWRSTTLEDVVTNLLLYVPIGFALAGTSRDLLSRRFFRFVLAVLTGICVSVFAETVQTGIAARVASWTDVLLNGFGTAAGALAAPRGITLSRTFTSAVLNRLRQRPFATMAHGLILGLCVHGLAPFDFITSTDQLHGAFRQAARSFSIAPVAPAGAQDPSGLLTQVPGTLWYAVLGYLLAISQRRRGQGTLRSLGSAMKHGFILAGVLEVVQLFTLSHQFEPVAMALHWVAVTLGGWGGTFIVDDFKTDDWKRVPALAAPRSLLIFVACIQILLLLASSVSPDIRSLHSVDLSRVQWIPFEGIWRLPISGAIVSVMTAVITFSGLALSIMLAMRQSSATVRWVLTSALVFIPAVISEALQSCSGSRTPDVTDPVLALGTLVFLFGALRAAGPGPLHTEDLPVIRGAPGPGEPGLFQY